MARKQANPIIEVNGIDIIIGNTYEIIGKKDFSAPDGFQKFETTKYLIPGIKEVRSIPYDESQRRYDTGFEEYSNCNRSIPSLKRVPLVDTYVKHIKEPYERWSRESLDSTNEEFWGGSSKKKPYMYDIYTGKTFDTNKIDELFDLFNILKQGAACKKGEKDPTLKASARYCIRDREKTVSLKEEKATNKAEATFTFMTLINALDPKKSTDDTLYTILEWLQFTSVRNSDKEALKSMVLKRFDDPKTGYDTAEKFLQAYAMTKDESSREEMELFGLVSRLNGKGVFEYKRMQYFLNDKVIGNNLKGIAKKALTDESLKKELIDELEKHS